MIDSWIEMLVKRSLRNTYLSELKPAAFKVKWRETKSSQVEIELGRTTSTWTRSLPLFLFTNLWTLKFITATMPKSKEYISDSDSSDVRVIRPNTIRWFVLVVGSSTTTFFFWHSLQFYSCFPSLRWLTEWFNHCRRCAWSLSHIQCCNFS